VKIFTVTVPTYKREKDLGECLESLIGQSVTPNEILVIDDDVLPEDFLARWRARFAEKSVAFTYYRKDHAIERRGLSESKNIALKKAAGEIIFFFDDDVVVGDDFLSAIMNVWGADLDPKLLGVGGLVENVRSTIFLERIYNALFGLTSEHPWDINDVAYQVWDRDIKENTKGYYLLGGVSSYRRAEMEKLGFATFSGGRTELEDVDLCLKAKRAGYHMMLVPKAKVLHKESPTSREAEFLIGAKEAFNRKDIYRRYGLRTLKGRLWFAWASFGWILRQVLVLHWRGAAGRVYGFLTKPAS
jgi:GT2 family glycosyltransferase